MTETRVYQVLLARGFIIALSILALTAPIPSRGAKWDATGSQGISGPNCESFFLRVASQRVKPLEPLLRNERSVSSRISDRLSLFISHAGWVNYAEERFDIRILSRGSSRYSVRHLKETAIMRMDELLRRMEMAGFPQSSFIQVIIDANEGGLRFFESGVLTQGAQSNGQPRLNSSVEVVRTPFVGTKYNQIYMFGFRRYRQFLGTRSRRGFQNTASILYLPAYGERHWLDRPFAIAHELAHTTENINSHLSEIWSEARADVIAYLTTGEYRVEAPDHSPLKTWARDGAGAVIVSERVIRDLAEPRVTQRSEIIPELGAFHSNSELVSGLLFKMANQFGRDRVVEFIRYMDSVEGSVIPRLVLGVPNTPLTPGFRFLHPNSDRGSVARAIGDEVDDILFHLQFWAKQNQLSLKESQWLDRELKWISGIDELPN